MFAMFTVRLKWPSAVSSDGGRGYLNEVTSSQCHTKKPSSSNPQSVAFYARISMSIRCVYKFELAKHVFLINFLMHA